MVPVAAGEELRLIRFSSTPLRLSTRKTLVRLLYPLTFQMSSMEWPDLYMFTIVFSRSSLNADFVFSLFVCSIAVFFELNVLMSVVVGYWVCRSTYFFGHLAGIDANNGFPWFDDQSVGAYLGYFLVVVALSAIRCTA